MKKKIVLLGDSIRLLGYGKRVAELLGDDYEVFQPEDNGRFASYTLRMLFDYAPYIRGADVIHFNCGLWDECDLFGDGPFTPLPAYVDTMVRIARVAKGLLAPGGKVIFATTTVPTERLSDHSYDRIRQFNRAVIDAYRTPGSGLEDVVINDLFTPVRADVATMICEDNIHLSAAGVETCAALVVKAVRSACEG